jgi:hypothetical protein
MDAPTTCFCCGGTYHPATGDWDARWGVALCGVCVERKKRWYKQQVNRGVAGDNDREDDFATFYEAAETSIRPGATPSMYFQRFVRVPNPKAQSKRPKRAGRWRAGPDGVRVLTGPRPVRAFVWISA